MSCHDLPNNSFCHSTSQYPFKFGTRVLFDIAPVVKR